MVLKNKKVLITAGPTWVKIDDVRVISNIATGETGILLAKKLRESGACVTLILGQSNICCLPVRIKVIHFKFFEELKDAVKRQLRKNKYDIIIHSAAVSDFRPGQVNKGKIDSGCLKVLKLTPLPKIIGSIKALAPKAFLIMFKLEPRLKGQALIKKAIVSLQQAGANLVVACTLNPYRAFIIDRAGNKTLVRSKADLARKLSNVLSFI